MSRFGIVPTFDVKQLGTADDDAINRLLTALQEAIKQVQNVAELGSRDGLTEETPEACCLCEHLDRVFLYGLREPQWGYWPWVRQFTHPAAQQEIAGGPCPSTDLGRGRAWLLASLNGGLLEGYMRSFHQNPRLVHRGYSARSFLRDPQHLELLATLVSGLEHVPFQLNPNNPLLDDTSAWSKLVQPWLATGECAELSQGCLSGAGMTVSSSTTSSASSSREDDSGIQSVYASCATLSSLASPAEEVPDSCRCADCVALGDRERIRRIINMDIGPPSDDPSDGSNGEHLELEVTRVVLTRRKRGSRDAAAGRPPRRESACGAEAGGPGAEPEGTQSAVAVVAKEATPDPPLPGARGDAAKQVTGDIAEDERTAVPLVQEALGLPNFIRYGSVTSERGNDTEEFVWTSQPADLGRDSHCFTLAEDDRGAPDGCEEGGGVDEAQRVGREEQCEEMFSIYDSKGKFGGGLTTRDEPGSVHSSSPKEKMPLPAPFGGEEDSLPATDTSTKEGLDIKVENCALLYLMLQIFGSEDEKLYKMFLAWKCVDGRLEPVYVLVTNESLYTLSPGPEVNQFACDWSARLSELEVVTVWLNYHGFSLTCASRERVEVATGHAELTRNILSSLDLAIRRSDKGANCLPSIVSHCSEQLDALKKLLACELKFQGEELVVRDYRLVHWEQRRLQPGSPGGPPTASGPLMWRFFQGDTGQRKKKKAHWQAGHFLLRAGILYRFANQGDTIPDATYLVSGFPCAPCQAVTDVGRPHALQLNLSSPTSGPGGGTCLQLAASHQSEAERWVRALSEAQQSSSSGPGGSRLGCLVACCLVMAGDLMLTLVEGSRVLGLGAVMDLGAVHSEGNFCALEFESGEAEKSCARSWLFWFATEEEKDEFLAVVSACWQEIFKVSLDILPMSNGSLRNHCLGQASQLEKRLRELKEFCLDS